MDKAWFLLMLHAGLRTCEIRRLKEADIDWERRKVRIERSKGMKDRFVYLSQAACEALRAYLLLRGPLTPSCELVFLYRHDPLGSRYCQQRLNTYGKRCGIRLTPHQLRHSCATLLLNAGAPILTVQALLGHRRIDTTLGYARLYDGTIAADYYLAMGKIEGHLALDELDINPLPDPRGEILALIAALQNDSLPEIQASIVQYLKTKVLSSYLCDVKVPVEPN
jgi:integrase